MSYANIQDPYTRKFVDNNNSRICKLIGIGDSITSGSGGSPFVDLACNLAGGRTQFMPNKGIGGQTTTQILARFDTDIIAQNPDIVHILAGINDITLPTTVIANLKSMVDKSLSAGILPIVGSLLPKDAGSATEKQNIININRVMQLFCSQRAVPFINYYSKVVNAANDNWNTSYSTDGLHPSYDGSLFLAQMLDTRLRELIPDRTPLLGLGANDATNSITNSLYQVDTNADGIPDGVSVDQDTNYTASLVTDANITGKWLQVAKTSGNDTRIIYTASMSAVAGDKIRVAFRWQTESLSGLYLRGVFANQGYADGITLLPDYRANSNPTAGNVMIADHTVTTSWTAMRFYFQLRPTNGSSGSGTLRIAEPVVINLTQQGLV